MSAENRENIWQAGKAPVAVVMISLNEGHNMEGVLENLRGWAQEVFLIDSYSRDETVSIALRYGVRVVQRRFRGFGDQWNFALRELPITAPWTMKHDPDERLSEKLKENIIKEIQRGNCDGLIFNCRWWFMGHALPIREKVLRVWRTGSGWFSNVSVNEHVIIKGKINFVHGDMNHLDSPDIAHWLHKQNSYSTTEAINAYMQAVLTDSPNLFGSQLQRRMWMKKHFYRIPFRYTILFVYFWLWRGLWRLGRVGYMCAWLFTDAYRLVGYKLYEMESTGCLPVERMYGVGEPDQRVQQYE